MKDEKEEKIFYRTQSLDLAVTLLTLNFPIAGFDSRDDTPIVTFFFEDNPELRKTIDDFWNRRLKIEPNTLLRNRAEVLNEIKHKNFTQ